MCGRYTRTSKKDVLLTKFKFQPPVTLNFQPQFNLAPTQNALVVILDKGRELRALRWGLIPSWAKDASIGYNTINARAEEVHERPAYRAAFRQRRCLVLTDGYFEWKHVGRKKIPYLYVLKDRQPYAFAGVWEVWQDAEKKRIESFSIITTEPNKIVGELHDRMPVILDPKDYDEWLDPQNKNVERLRGLLKPFGGPMEYYEVSPLVNSYKNDVAECISPVGKLF